MSLCAHLTLPSSCSLTREASLEQVKRICGEVRRSVGLGRLVLASPLHCADLRISSMRFLRDPDGEHSHGVVTVEALVTEETA